MKILDMRTINGPNVYHHRPVLIMNVDLEDLVDVASDEIANFNPQLLKLLPGLKNHRCSPRYSGGFVERLKRGTYLAHIIEHVGLELSVLCGIGVSFGKSLASETPGQYRIIVRSKSEEAMKFLMGKSVEIIESIIFNRPFDLESCLNQARQIIFANQFGPSTSVILDAADRRNIPWRRINDQNLIQLGFGKYRQFIQASTTSLTSNIAVEIAQDKNLTKKLLADTLVYVPRGKPAYSLEEAYEIQKEMSGVPLALKPIDGNHGRGVSINIKTQEELASAFNEACKISPAVIIEESLSGRDYRILVIGGKVVAAAERIPAFVVGDGIHTLLELIQKENENPLRGEGHENILTKISIDYETTSILQKRGLTLEHVAAEDEICFLKETANLSTGGTAIDKTDEIHPEIKAMCERTARIVGLDICGVDLICEDISQSLSEQRGGVIEVNAGPGLRMHHYPSVGRARDVGLKLIDHLYPNQINGRIPIVAITGTNGKTTVSRLLSHLVFENGQSVGTTTTDGIYLNEEKIVDGDNTGPLSARTVLSDPAVEVAVLETARGGIIKRGLGYDWSDIGIFTNLEADHIGQDGIKSIEDILKIKSLVIERVKNGGNVILNADSPGIVSLTQNSRTEMDNKKLTYFSLRSDNSVIQRHLALGGHAYFLRAGEIIEAQGTFESSILHTEDIPITLKGTALFHVANVMAVIAGAHALGISDEVILRGLQNYRPDKNLGRTTLYKIGKGFLLLDYGHNPDAFLSIGQMSRMWNISKLTAVLGAPGDRNDDIMKMIGEVAARVFDKIIIREDQDLRGRTSGAVAKILYDTIISKRGELECQIELNSSEALKVAVSAMEEGELIVYFYEELNSSEKIVAELGGIKWTDTSLFGKNSARDKTKKRGDEWLQFSY